MQRHDHHHEPEVFSMAAGVFSSEQLTGALLDRLTHHAHNLAVNGESSRFRESLKKVGDQRQLFFPLHGRRKNGSGKTPERAAEPVTKLHGWGIKAFWQDPK
jgi:hypothetical protein